MKRNIKTGIGAILVFALLLSVAMSPASAIPAGTKSTEKEIIIGKGGETQSKVPVADAGMGILAGKEWTATTDIWFSTFSGMHSDHYSQSRDNGAAWDIDKIAVRGRAWRDNVLQMDKTDTRYNSADAQIQEVVCNQFYCGGSWRAQGDHTFEEAGYQSWYPTTSDTW